MEDLRQSDNWGKHMKSLGWERVSLGEGKGIGYLRKFLGIFSIIKIQRPYSLPVEEEVNMLAKKYRAVLVKLEPGVSSKYQIPNTKYSHPDSWPLLPPSEIHLNISLQEETILKSFSENARRNLNKVKSQKLKVKSFSEVREDEIIAFWKMMRSAGGERGFFVEELSVLKNKIEAFRDSGYLVLVEDKGGKLVAGICVLEFDGMAYYDLAGATKEGKRLNAPYFALWQAILEAKKRGNQIFNLEGVYDPRFPSFTRNWKGFSEFKSRFGGWKVEYPGSFSKWYLFGHKLFG